MNLASAYPSPALPAWQLALIALVAVGALVAWLAGVFLAARVSRRGAGDTGMASPAPSADESDRQSPEAERKAA